MDKSFIDLFKAQVLKTPENIAVVFEGKQCTYLELNEKANDLAITLNAKGVIEDSLVPIYIERGINMIVGILGIMKAGGAYVPIDTDFPVERINYMLKDTSAAIVVSSKHSRLSLPEIDAFEIVEIESVPESHSQNLPAPVKAGQLAYVIYTSGSTGMPKGVMIEHGNLVDYVNGLIEKTQINESRSFALVSTIATDLGNTVIYASLATGGTLHLFTKESVSNIEYLHSYFAKHSIDCLKIVPSHWKALSMDDQLLLPKKLLVFGGEALPEKIITDIWAANATCRVVNHYGPTETTIGKLLHVVEHGAKYEFTVPIGKPFSNIKVLILTKNLKLCPIGVPGQLYITGDGVARGYLNNPELTKEKFIPNPFSKQAHAVMYSTGDLVKYLPDGNISFIGRVDNQVKIRGYRIELGEIENILQQCALVDQVVVLAKEDKQGNKRLVGYIMPEGEFDKDAILTYLKDKLPDYMIPGILIEVESMPLTANGKIDRNALPDPEAIGLQEDLYLAPRNDIEDKLATIWQDILEVDQVGVNDDFFELGGHSLLAVRLVSAIRKAFVVEMPISDIFDFPTVALLSQQLSNNTDNTVLTTIQAITPRPERIPLSFSQERLWFIDHLEGSVQYHLPTVLRLKGLLNRDALSHTLQQIVNRHEVLRTVIMDEAGKPYQFVKDTDGWALTITDGAAYGNDQDALKKYIQQLIAVPFDLSKDYLLRANMVCIGTEEHVLLVTMHHIASDAWSTPVLVKEVVELYSAYLEGRPASLSPLGLQYADYAIWQRNYLQGEVLNKKLDYWKQKLEGITALEIPADFQRPAAGSIRGAAMNFRVEKGVADQLQDLSQQQGSTLFMTLLAAFKVLLSRYSGQQDISVGTSIANRTQQEMEDMVGFFVNTLTLRSKVEPDASFNELLQTVKTTTMEAYAHQDVPFEKVVETVVKERDNSRSPLFQVMLVLRNTAEAGELRLGELTLSGVQFELTTAKFDITFFVTETVNGLICSVQYSTDLYKEETISRMITHFKELLSSVVKAPQQKISSLQMLTHQEQNMLLNETGINHVIYPSDKSVVDLFIEQAEKTPGNIAVVFEGRKITYKELHEKSNQLAHALRSKGVTNDTLVPVYIERGIDMVIAIIGIMKAGAAYVPIDTDFPADRIGYMLKDANAAIIVSSEESSLKLLIEPGIQVVTMQDIVDQPVTNLPSKVQPNNLAYVIYTSGSTGKPKGVMIEHRSLVDYYFGLKQKIQISECNSFALVSTLATDLGNTVIYSALLSGAALHIFSKEAVSDTELLHSYFNTHKIDCLKIVPSHWKALSIDEQLLLPEKLLVFGGEALQAGLVEDILNTRTACSVVNHYGPTETTIGKLLHVVEAGRTYGNTVPVGKPFSNTQVYVLSRNFELCPVGVPGQLYIAGDGVARGYYNNPVLTKEKFIANPFAKESGGLMYGTGDLVKYLPDGNIEFIGRVDDQVKIRGYRIELGEIESILQQSELVKHAVVLVKEDKQGNKRLVAYVVADGYFSKDEIIDELKERLPEYMIPATIMELETLPFTANGKVDRKALPDPDAAESAGSEYEAPRNEMETILTGIWQDVLDLEKVGIHDNFFELGGDSIISIQVVSRARRAGCDFQVADVFTYQTIASLVEYVEQRIEQKAVSTEQTSLTGPAGLLPVQQWYFEKQPVEISHFNQAVILAIDKAATEPMIKSAVQHLTAYHDALRFNYQQKDGGWIQEYGNDEGDLITLHLGDLGSDCFKTSLAAETDKIQRSLDITKGPLAKFVLVKTPRSETNNRLLVVIHHLAIDGVSWRVLLEDLELLLDKLKTGEAIDLGKKTSSYRQWYEALEKYGQSPAFLSQKEYWEQAVKSYQPLPADTDYNGDVRQKDKSGYSVRLGKNETRQLLQDIPKVYHTEINDLLLCALAKTIADWSQNENVLIGLEGHGRENISDSVDTSRTVGWFTTHYPLLLKMGNIKSTSDAIKTVKEQLRQVPDKGIGFGILKYIEKDEAVQGREPWDIVFNYLGQLDNIVKKSKWLSVAGESAGVSTSEEYGVNEKLWINGSVRDEEMVFYWTYSNLHFNETTVQQLANNYLTNLTSLVSHCVETQASGELVYTPSDFGLGAEISYSELDTFLNEPFNGKPQIENIEALYRLSGLQQGILFHGLYDGKGEGYINHFWADLINPQLDILSKSWDCILKRHTILRSAFNYDSFNIPVQYVYHDVQLSIEVIDYRGMTIEEQAISIKQFEASDKARGFNFKVGPMMRISLFRLNDERYRMLWTSHHILFDGWSRSILMSEFLNIYEQLAAGNALPLLLEDRYEDYIRYIEKIDKDKEQSYWKNYLQSVEQGTLLPFINTTTERNKGVGLYSSIIWEISNDITEQIEQYAQQHRITLNTLMQGVWSYLLHQYTGSDDIVYGVIVSGRPDDLPHVEQRIGMFINTLPLCSHFKKDQGIIGWLQDIQNNQVASRQYQYTALSDIQQWTGVRGDMFDSLFIFENYPVSKVLTSKQWSLEVKNVKVNEQTNYPLCISISNAGRIHIDFGYNTGLLKKESVEKIRQHFEHVLLQVIEKSNGRIGDIVLLTDAEQQQLLVEFNNTRVNYPKSKSIVDLFEEQVARTPDKIAIVFEQEQWSYKELNERSNRLAHYLRAKGVKEDILVPVCIERSVGMIVGILGILKSGGAYVPIDTDYPDERIRYMLKDMQATIVVSSRLSRLKLVAAEDIDIIEIEGDWEVDTRLQGLDSVQTIIKLHQLAYVIYTSGSTGRPKGVMIEHAALLNYVLGFQQYFSINADDIVLQQSSTSFDTMVEEIYPALITGACIHLIKDGGRDIENLRKFIENNSATILSTTPMVIEYLNKELSGTGKLRYIISGGDILYASYIDNLFGKVAIVNSYGPSETTVCATYNKLENIAEASLIGKPIDNAGIYITSREQQLVPVGVVGEICIGGAGLARGYLNNEQLTNTKFISNHFNKEAGARIYKTGDLGRWLPEGNIEYLGRIDEQVKIRGYRIELGEIETVIQQTGLVQQCVVMPIEDKDGDKRLVGYVVPEAIYNRQALNTRLRNMLPGYMVPTLWIELESLPLTVNGKINKKALPDPDVSSLVNKEYVEPRNELESKIAFIWSELLQIKMVGVHDNFFELGGHSLLAVRLVSAIRRKLDLTLTINDVFIYPTIASFANNIVEKIINPSLPIVNIKFLVPIKPSGNKIPLYIVCGAGGTALRFKKFAEMMDADQPVYILQPPIDSDTKGFPQSIEEISKIFIEEICINNPEGPYALSGHCLGGIIAFEMAKQLKAMGKPVHLLAMFDTVIRKKEKPVVAEFANFYNIPVIIKRILSKAILKIDFETFLLRKHTRKAIGYKLRSFRSFFKKKLKKKESHIEDMDNVGLEIFDESSEVYRIASRNYRMIPYDGEILLFYAKVRYYFTDVNNNIRFKKVNLNHSTKNLWREYSPSVEIHEIEGDHSDIFETSHGNQFASLLQKELNKTELVN
ncbi:MAG: amino acid adenylation domain-containing protein [Ferruginibacter sp.]